jgi:hypothetical protein
MRGKVSEASVLKQKMRTGEGIEALKPEDLFTIPVLTPT